MPRGSKSSYSAKQKRQAAHIEESYEKRGVSPKEAGERAWRTVNKTTGGAKGKKASRSKGGTRRKSSTRRKSTASTTRRRSTSRKRSRS